MSEPSSSGTESDKRQGLGKNDADISSPDDGSISQDTLSDNDNDNDNDFNHENGHSHGSAHDTSNEKINHDTDAPEQPKIKPKVEDSANTDGVRQTLTHVHPTSGDGTEIPQSIKTTTSPVTTDGVNTNGNVEHGFSKGDNKSALNNNSDNGNGNGSAVKDEKESAVPDQQNPPQAGNMPAPTLAMTQQTLQTLQAQQIQQMQQQVQQTQQQGQGQQTLQQGQQVQQPMQQAQQPSGQPQSMNPSLEFLQNSAAGQANMSNPTMQMPLNTATANSLQTSMLVGKNPPSIGGLTGKNAEYFIQGLVAAQQANMNNTNISTLTSGISNGLSSPAMFGLPSTTQPEIEDKSKKNDRSESYRDFSRLPCPTQETDIVPGGTTAPTTSGKEPPFPVKLHRILSNPEYCDFISWLPHGRSWRVLKPKAFEEKIVPRYFRHTKYASFMRQVNGWGFKRMTQGPDHNSYYHELFLRGLPHLCIKMRRPARAKIGQNDADNNPDFYRLSLVAPLPNNGSPASNTGLPPNASAPTNDLSYMSGLQQTNNANKSMGFLQMPGNSENTNNNFLPQQFQSTMQPNLGSLGQLSGLNQSSIPGMNGGNNNMQGLSGSTNAEISQLDALRQRREELVRQLQGMKSQSVVQPVQQKEPTSMMNQMNAYGAFQPAATTQLIPSQLQQMMAMGTDNSNNQMGQLLQIPGLNMAGQQFNINNLVGRGAAPAPMGGLNQQLLMQQTMNGVNNNGGLAMNNNNLMAQQFNPFGQMMHNQMGQQVGVNLGNFQQMQFQQQQQQQPQQQQQQRPQSGQIGNMPPGSA